MKKKNKVKVELSMNHVIVTANTKNMSGLITNLNGNTKDVSLLPIQEVLAVGPFCSKDNGICFNVGDMVRLDTRRIQAKNAMVIDIRYDKETGKIIQPVIDDGFDEDKVSWAFLITDREILYKVVK